MGQTCASCGYLATRSGCLSRECRNPAAFRWNRDRTLPDAEACDDYIPAESLFGRLSLLGDAMGFLTLAVRIASGEIAGTVDDPRHPDPPKTPRKRSKK